MHYALIVILLMVCATVAVHLGLTTAVLKVVSKIASCHKCLTFWSSLGTLLFIGCDILLAVLLSLLGAYLSNWFALYIVELSKKYNEIWHVLNKESREEEK